MSEPGQGRARGRGGRGRKPQQQQAPPGLAPQQAPPQQMPPGGAPAAPVGRGRSRGARQMEPTAQIPPVQQTSAAPEAMYGGRGVQRGGGRERPHGGDEGLSSLMGQLNVSGRPDYVRRKPFARYVEKQLMTNEKNSVGKNGTAVTVLANCFEVKLASDMKIFQYHVGFKPPVENIRVRFALIAQACEGVGAKNKLFDGGILYLSQLFAKDPYVTLSERKDSERSCRNLRNFFRLQTYF